MVSINTNLSSMIVQQNLNKSTNALNLAIERMTTGFKINHASDNAANYSISQTMNSQISSYTVAEDNASMGIDMVKTAMDSMDLISSHLSRIRDLAEQASNGTYGQDSLNAINQEVQARVEEVNRIIANTEFNGIQLLEGGGVDPNGVTGAFLAPVTQLTEEEATAQGYTIIRTADELQAMSGSGKYILMNDIDLQGYDWERIESFNGELNGNGHVIKNLSVHNEGNAGLIGFSMSATYKNLGLENVDIEGFNAGGLWGGGPGNTVTNVYVTGRVHGTNYAGGIFGGGEQDTLTNCYVDCVVTCDDTNNCGAIVGYGANEQLNNVYYNIDKTANAYGTASFGTSGGVGLTASELDALIIKPASGGAANIKLQVGISGDTSSQIDLTLGGLGLSNFGISFTTSEQARSALSTIDGYLQTVSSKQTEYGAVYNRLESAIESIGVNMENLTSSLSTIRDADIAEVSSEYIRQQILQQASATLLATANQSPSIALQLI